MPGAGLLVHVGPDLPAVPLRFEIVQKVAAKLSVADIANAILTKIVIGQQAGAAKVGFTPFIFQYYAVVLLVLHPATLLKKLSF